MKRIEAILMPTDFSSAVESMAPVVADLVKRFGAHLTLLHAFDMAPEYALPKQDNPHESAARSLPYTAELQELRTQRHHQLLGFVEAHFGKIACAARIEDGDAADVVEWVARQEQSDLIVMPSGEHGKLRHIVFGSLVARILHDTAFPLLTAAPPAEPGLQGKTDLRSIVCAIDTNPQARDILDAAVMFVRAYSARLCVLHVEGARTGEDPMAMVRDCLKQPGDLGDRVIVRLLDSSVAEGVQQTILEQQADLLVVGRGHESDTFSRLLSPLYKLIEQSPCPVLTV